MPRWGRVCNSPLLTHAEERLPLRELSSLPASLSQVARVTLYKRPREENGTRLPLLVLLGIVLFSHPGPAWAQPARLYIDSALMAMGGRAALLGLKSQRIVSHGEN